MRTIVHAANAPISAAPVSQAVRWRDLVFVSGQVARDVETGTIVGASVAEQARQVLRNLAAILEAAGSSLEECLKLNCYLVDMGEAGAFNEAYREFFAGDPPARTTVGVAGLAKGVLIEIDAIGSIQVASGSASTEPSAAR